MLTAVEFAERAGVSYPTVMGWLRKSLIPGAKLKKGDPLGTYWAIPVTSLDKVKPQKRGPKPKPTSASDDPPTTVLDEVKRATKKAGSKKVGKSEKVKK